jgi:hypothetical protein
MAIQDAARARMAARRRPPPAAARPGLYAALALVSALAWLVAGDVIAALAVWVLLAGWRMLPAGDGPPVLAMAYTFQWVQVTAGLWYHALTGIRLPAIELADHRPMMLIGLGCLLALLLGLRLGIYAVGPRAPAPGDARPAFGWRALILAYVASVALTGTLQELAWETPSLTQGILALTYARFALLFLMFRRLSQGRIRIGWIAFILAGEVVLGFTGYFAGFREPMMMAAMALTGAFDRRRVGHWVVLGALGLVMVLTGVIWMGIRSEYRRDFEDQVFARSREARLDRIAALSSKWIDRSPNEILSDVDLFVDRLWAVYYPAMALGRVPAILPHEHGEILRDAVLHALTPRVLFPDKPPVESDSEKVRRYSGVFVAGPEENTSIAFGYAGEAYVDFGLPLMFAPVLGFGLLMGSVYQALLRLCRHRELAVASVTVIFWLSLYLFERSWINMVGLSLTLIAYLGGATLVIDRLLSWRRSSGGPVPSGARSLRVPPRPRGPRPGGASIRR